LHVTVPLLVRHGGLRLFVTVPLLARHGAYACSSWWLGRHLMRLWDWGEIPAKRE